MRTCYTTQGKKRRYNLFIGHIFNFKSAFQYAASTDKYCLIPLYIGYLE